MEKTNCSPGRVFGFFFFTIELILVLSRTCQLPGLCSPVSGAIGAVGRFPKLSPSYINLAKQLKIIHTKKLGPGLVERLAEDAPVEPLF